jgi:hypothetical protein
VPAAALHAEREAFHREKRSFHDQELSDVLRRLTRQGRLEQVRVGKGRYEARFVRVE